MAAVAADGGAAAAVGAAVAPDAGADATDGDEVGGYGGCCTNHSKATWSQSHSAEKPRLTTETLGKR